MLPLRQLSSTKRSVHRFSTAITLSDGAPTTVHVVRYDRSAVRPKLVLFDRKTRLLDWCERNSVKEAMGGGFFLRASSEVLGELWVEGANHPSVGMASPWHATRGSVHITAEGQLDLGPRHQFDPTPSHSLLQAGPLLARRGISQVADGADPEGFSAASHQFDSDITEGRYPRAAIGVNDKYTWTVVCDGRAPGEAGLTMPELADVMLTLGAEDALNLDGGSSASQVSDGILRNRSRGGGIEYSRGRPIHTAIIFQ